MDSIKKKPKPFSAMTKSRRYMVLGSLILVLLGCFALYSAMQNEEWTRDEPSQRKVFFLAFLLLMTSIGLCYYALNGDLEEDNEKYEVERLTSVKYGGYNSIKSESTLTRIEKQIIDNDSEKKLLELLEPQDQNSDLNDQRRQKSSVEKSNKQSRNGRRAKSPIIYNVDEVKTYSNLINQSEVDNNSNVDRFENYVRTNDQPQNCVPRNDKEGKARSLLVELMPLLPLQLAEKELSRLNNSQQEFSLNPSNSNNRSDCNQPLPQKLVRPELPCTFGPVHKNADAG